MSHDTLEHVDNEPPMHPGQRLREHRKMRRFSVREIAEKTELSASFISQFERGLTNASVSSLRRMAYAVGVSMADLFEDPATRRPSVLRAEDRPKVSTPSGLSKYLVSRHPLKNLEIYAGEFEPGAGTGTPYVHEAAQEIFLVVSGELLVELDGIPHLLKSEDSIEYQSTTQHSVRNIGAERAVGYWISSPPRRDGVPEI